MSYKEQFQQLTLDYICEKGKERGVPAKRVDIVYKCQDNYVHFVHC